MEEPFSIRWRRRAVTIPTILGATVAALFGLPILLPAVVIADVVRWRWRLPTARVYLFALQYLVNDSLEVLLAPVLWMMAGAGTGLNTNRSMARHRKLQNWSVRTMARRAEQLLGLPVGISEADRAALEPGPIIVISRHVSLLDASLPGLILERCDFEVRGVIMAELLADPGFDLIYNRTGSVFIPRDNSSLAVTAIEAMAADVDRRVALVIFPEGRLFRPSVRDRQLARLAERDRQRAERLAGIEHVLPPRPGGLFGLLDAVPDADVVLLDHRGLDRFKRLADLTAAVPVGEPVAVTVTRIARADIPNQHQDRLVWLDQLWLELDRSVGRSAPTVGRAERR